MSGFSIPASYLTGCEADVMSRQRAAVEEAQALKRDGDLVRPIVEQWQSMTLAEQEAAIERGRLARERREREEREAAERARAKVSVRISAVVEAVADATLVAVVRLHSPREDWLDVCAGCPSNGEPGDWDGCGGHDWPCSTFLLVEEHVAPSTPARDEPDSGR